MLEETVTPILLRSIPVYWSFLSYCRPHLSVSQHPICTTVVCQQDIFCHLWRKTETSGLLVGISRSLQIVGSNIIKALDEIKGVADILAIMLQNSEESFDKIMDAADKMAKDMNIAVDKSRLVKRSVYQVGAANGDKSVSNYYRVSMYISLQDIL